MKVIGKDETHSGVLMLQAGYKKKKTKRSVGKISPIRDEWIDESSLVNSETTKKAAVKAGKQANQVARAKFGRMKWKGGGR